MVSVAQQLEQSLFIATSKTVHSRTQLADRILFECNATGGITNARASRDNSRLFAVADSHVVMLCDALRGSKKCRLRKGDGEPRLLLLSPDSRTLYFTTTLSPSVQAYDIPTTEMLPSQQPHPSPPNVISVSSNGDVLLSASPAPPTLYIQDRRWRGSAPVKFQPTDAETPVSCAAFSGPHTPTDNLHTSFVLGFRDGKMAMYRLFLPTMPEQRKQCELGGVRTFDLQPVRIGAIKKLHKASMGGVVAAEFVPGYTSRIISIGHDGRCRLVDFEGGGKDGTVLFGGDAAEENDEIYEGLQTLIAIGTESGKVFIFNCLGLLVHDIAMEQPIIALEWVGDMSAPSLLPNHISSMSPEPQPVVDTTIVDIEESSDEELGTMRRNLPVSGNAIPALNNISAGPDLFSADHMSAQPSRRPSAISAGSPFRTRCTRHQAQRKFMNRPRIVTDTFQSPLTSSNRPSDLILAATSALPTPPLRETRNWPKYRTPSTLPPASYARRLPSSSASPTRDTEFFTPPSTRRDKSRILSQLSNLRASAKDAAQPPASSPASSTSLLPDTSPASITSTPWQRRLTSLAPKRQCTVEAPSTPDLRTTSSIYSQPSPPVRTSTSNRLQHLEPRTSTSTPPWLSSPSSPRSHFASKLKLESTVNYLAEIPDSESPTSLYSRGLGLLDGQSFSQPGGSTLSADELQKVKGLRSSKVSGKTCLDEIVRSRRDIEKLEREMEGLRGEMRDIKELLLARK
ncbi:hypothetical protein HBI38_000980 [Parastagonospora nodorum]|nr:hypothetical protein HBH74_013350 [Parastagonospora nodorum]KAH4997125.1 hypothetical protein HBH73_000240 [Parastagonospora nodorum]KAH5191501.1 hypothetical protein HBH76_077130 [Parastagonospora nodorum]KAH5673559.1 hypothetical protein HBI21_148740 [Parastagonospora nodorum]KAH6228392.1 hypothetical protein HBI15_082810 [Parastagonospora nodorum]